jgi:endonuclease YncB( thermonuclease family)
MAQGYRRQWVATRACAGLLAALCATACFGAEWTLSGRVVALKDGDSFVLLAGKTQHPVRIAGIDAPEWSQRYSNASKRTLSGLVFNRSVVARCSKRDRYGRNVCRVFGDNGQDIGLEMVRAGMAWWYRGYAREQTPEERGAYQGAEDAARVTKRGLWTDAKPIPPWQYSRASR